MELQKIDPSVSLPYWDWTVDNSWQSPLWSDSVYFMGGAGTGPNNRVMTGPFAYNPLTAISWSNGSVTATTTTAHGVQVGDLFQIVGVVPTSYNGRFTARTGMTGNTLVYALATNPGQATVLGGTGWVLNILPTGQADPFLKRNSGSDLLPVTPDDVSNVLKSTPYNKWPLQGGFRPDLEAGVHTRAHDWVGGSMGGSCSPNDPVFWLHHCNIDRLWAEWQLQNPGWPYLPPSGTVYTTSRVPRTRPRLRRRVPPAFCGALSRVTPVFGLTPW
jgi:tyrosinase